MDSVNLNIHYIYVYCTYLRLMPVELVIEKSSDIDIIMVRINHYAFHRSLIFDIATKVAATWWNPR